MTRAAGITGMLLGAIALVWGLTTGAGSAAMVEGVAVGGVVLVLSALTLLRTVWAEIVLAAAGLAVLSRFLPHYFQTYRMWPDLPLLLLGSFTFGLALLGLLMDRVRPENGGRERRSHL